MTSFPKKISSSKVHLDILCKCCWLLWHISGGVEEWTISLSFLLLGFKSKLEKKPVFLQKYLSKPFNYRTRASLTGCIVQNEKTTTDISKDSFLLKSTKMWNLLPPHIKQAATHQEFKWKVKAWIKQNVAQWYVWTFCNLLYVKKVYFMLIYRRK